MVTVTLIVYVLTEEYVLLASDRRVVTFQGKTQISKEDKGLKTFILRGQMLMGYTGIAELDGASMEEWVAGRLNGVRPNAIPEALAQGMQEYFDRHPEVAKAPHHFRLAGFAYNPGRTPSKWPLGYEVGNCHWQAVGDQVRATGVLPRFGWRETRFGNRRQAVGAVGYPYSLRALRDLEAKVRLARRANPYDPSLVFGDVIAFMRAVAARSDGYVGDTILLTSMPKTATPMENIRWAVPLGPEGMSAARSEPFAMMLPAGSTDGQTYLPAMIYPGIQVIRATFGPTDPDTKG
jgi:hypothetical protein